MADRHPLMRGLIWVLKKGGQLFLFIVISLTVLELAVRAGYAFRKFSMGDDPQPYTFGHTYTSFPPWSDSVRLTARLEA